MNIRKRKQKGSSLVLVLMTFSVLTIVGLSILSLTLTAFKSRVVESSERRNQYFAESGIDIAYGEIGKVVDKGVEDGNNTAKEFMEEFEKSILPEERIKVDEGQISPYINSDGSVNEAYVKQIQNEKFQDSYKSSVISAINKWYDSNEKKYTIPISDTNYNSTGISKDLKVTVNAEEGGLKFKEIEIKGKKQTALNLKLSSDFKENSMLKTISVDYNILLPNYNDVYYVENKKFKLPINAVWSKAFCIDGNLNIFGDFEVKSGDVYVRGKDGDNSGINIEGNGISVKFAGNVSSFGGVQLSNKNNKLTVDGNIYAGNILLNDEADTLSLPEKGASLTVKGAVYTNNDLAVNGLGSKVEIEQGFYGINDVNKAEGINENEKPRVSSCLLVNSNDVGSGTSIEIKEEAILMGTAYIKTYPSSYQTGESVAIKGNYRAYTNPLNSSEAERKDTNKQSLKEDNVIFEYLDPLQLVTKFKDETNLSWQDKSDYFHFYAQEHKDDNELNLGNGITLPKNITHIGAIVANGDTANGNFINDNDGKVKDKQDKYSTKVYAMDDSEDIDVEEAFAHNEVKRRVYSSDESGNLDEKVSQVDFTKLNSNINSSTNSNVSDILDMTTAGNILYLNDDPTKDCILVGANAVIGEQYKNAKRIELQNGVGRGIILTRGNVYLAGDIDFKGTIISAESMATLDSGKKTLNYDINYVERLIAYNYDKYFKDVFIRNSTKNSQNVEVDLNVSKDSNAGTDVFRDKLIVMEKWKIIK